MLVVFYGGEWTLAGQNGNMSSRKAPKECRAWYVVPNNHTHALSADGDS